MPEKPKSPTSPNAQSLARRLPKRISAKRLHLPDLDRQETGRTPSPLKYLEEGGVSGCSGGRRFSGDLNLEGPTWCKVGLVELLDVLEPG